MGDLKTLDAVGQFCHAVESNDVDGMLATLSPTAELIPPVSGSMVFKGHDDLRVLLGAVFSNLTNLRWRQTLIDGDTRVAIFDAAVAGMAITDTMVIELDGDGLIQRLTPHIRPWLPLTVVSLALGPKMLRHPAVIRRGLREGRRT
ncbi:nuclear transport factor 2 family protein [Antrihabitans spumae]|uniref:Nuclear transport factor 2 family protein n=1 Tax=Antrihabitans spumae TaxID=3373370 RepID=A0ABW7KGR5_9NOCA